MSSTYINLLMILIPYILVQNLQQKCTGIRRTKNFASDKINLIGKTIMDKETRY